MSSKQSPDGVRQHDRWQEALDLGKKLFGLTRQLSAKAILPDDILSKLCEITCQTTQELLNCQVEFRLVESFFLNFVGKPQLEHQLEGFLTKPFSSLMELALQDKNILYAGRNLEKKVWVANNLTAVQPSKTIMVAMWAAGEDPTKDILLGFLQAESKNSSYFNQEDIQLVAIMAGQAALAFQAGLQLAVEGWRQEQLSLVQQVSAQIADVRDINKLFRQVTRLIQETFDYYYVAVFTLDPGKEILSLRASSSPDSDSIPDALDEIQTPVIEVKMGRGLVGTAAESSLEVLANNVLTDKRYQHLDLLPETRAEVALPLKIENNILGVLDVQSDQENYFDETDLVVLRALAGNIAVALNEARLYSSLRHRASQLSAIHEVSNAITSILDTERLFDEVVTLIQQRFGHSIVHLFSVHPGRRKIIFEAGSSALSRSLREEGFSYDLDDPQGLIPWVARHGDILLVNDVFQEPRYRPSMFAPVETQSELTVPLIFGGNVLGVLDVQSDQLDAFGEEDRFIFEALADNIAIAMRNANLYRSETWRRQAADSLREVAGLLSADVDANQVLHAILDELNRTLPLDIAAIWLLDEESQNEYPDQKRLFLAALGGEHADQLGFEYGLTIEDIAPSESKEQTGHKANRAAAWLIEALDAEKPVIRTPHAPFDPLGFALNYPLEYSAIATPLHVGGQKLGVLTLAHHTSGRYGSEAQAMTEAFASYAAVAIENARLYESAHEQAWISTVLLQVAEATHSQTNLNELLNTVIRIAHMLVGVRACLLYIVDEDGTFVPAAASGLNSEQQIEFESWRFAPGDVPSLDRLLEVQHPIVVNRQDEDTRLTNLFLSGDQEAVLLDGDLFVLAPMLAHDEVLGAFLIDYSPMGPGSNGDIALTSMFDERLAIIQGMAHQTAIAVENIRLNKSQKEEAYVSIALLQVAQAIVSSNELNEALGSIVRITPILVGVKRAVIFLWNEFARIFLRISGLWHRTRCGRPLLPHL